MASALLAALAACGTSDGNETGTGSGGAGGNPTGAMFSCSEHGSCPNDTAPVQASIDSCMMAASDPNCGSKFIAFGDCAIANIVCGSDGKSTIATGKCAQEETDYASCVEAHTGSGH